MAKATEDTAPKAGAPKTAMSKSSRVDPTPTTVRPQREPKAESKTPNGSTRLDF